MLCNNKVDPSIGIICGGISFRREDLILGALAEPCNIQTIVKLREGEGQRVNLGRSLKDHL